MTQLGPRRVVIIPSAPLFLPGLAQGGTAELDLISEAAVNLLARAAAGLPPSYSIGVLAAPSHFRDADAPVADSRAPSARNGIFGQETTGGAAPSLGHELAVHLLARAGIAERPSPLASDTDLASTSCDLLVVAATGSAARGSKAPWALPAAPGAGVDTDPGAALDATIELALTAGDLSALRTISDSQGLAVGCLDTAVWRGLGSLGTGWNSEGLTVACPLGVTYFVGRLTRTSPE